MTVKRAAPGAVLRIRTPVRDWGMVLGTGLLQLALGAYWAWRGNDSGLGTWFAWLWLGLGCLSVTQSLWLRTAGVDLTRDEAILRGFRRRTIAWRDVRAVVRGRRLGTWVVELVPVTGRPVMLRATTSWWGFGLVAFERDFRRIDGWWIENRGPS